MPDKKIQNLVTELNEALEDRRYSSIYKISKELNEISSIVKQKELKKLICDFYREVADDDYDFWFLKKICSNIKTLLKNSDDQDIPEDSEIEENKKKHCCSVLVAEDNEFNHDLMAIILKKLKLNFQIVLNGQEVIHELKSHKYDIIFLDTKMPELDGEETLKQIKEQNLSNARIFVLLPSSDCDKKDYYTNLGFDDFLKKPLNKEQIIKKLNL